MNDLEYSDFKNMQYKLIFDYFDRPLSFIAKIRSNDYLLYFISRKEYFISLIDFEAAKQLNELRDLTKLYRYLGKKNKINVAFFDFKNKLVNITPLDKCEDFKKYLPKVDDEIIFDYKNDIEINQNTDLFQFLDISDKPKFSDFIVRIFNPSNSHAYPSDIVQAIISHVSKYFNIVKESAGLLNDADVLFIRAFQKGSFQINFEIKDSDLREKTYNSISEVINKINDVYEKPDTEYLTNEPNKKMFLNTKEMYDEIIKKNNVTIEFKQNSNKQKNKNVSIKATTFVSDNIEFYNKQLDKITKEKDKNLKVKHVKYTNASFRSGSVNRNSLTFVNNDDVNNKNKRISAEFDPDLFEKIKNDTGSKYEITLRKPVTLEVNIEKDEDKEKNIITAYSYNN